MDVPGRARTLFSVDEKQQLAVRLLPAQVGLAKHVIEHAGSEGGNLLAVVLRLVTLVFPAEEEGRHLCIGRRWRSRPAAVASGSSTLATPVATPAAGSGAVASSRTILASRILLTHQRRHGERALSRRGGSDLERLANNRRLVRDAPHEPIGLARHGRPAHRRPRCHALEPFHVRFKVVAGNLGE